MRNRIKELLDNKGISQTWLAKKLGKSFRTVNMYCSNTIQPPAKALEEIAHILDVDLPELLSKEKKYPIPEDKEPSLFKEPSATYHTLPKPVIKSSAYSKVKYLIIDDLKFIDVPKEQVIMSFVSTCIEAAARTAKCSYEAIYKRMKKVRLIEDYIYPCYDGLHTESRENLAVDILECLEMWEKRMNN